MELTREQLYWADVAAAFIQTGNRALKIEDSNRHPYLKGEISVQTQNGKSFNLGSLVSDSYFEKREDIGAPESQKFRGLIGKLTSNPSILALSMFNNIALTEEPNSEIQGYYLIKDGLTDKILTIDLDYLSQVNQENLVRNIAKVSQNLSKRSSDSESVQTDEFIPGRTYVHATSLGRISLNSIRPIIYRVLYESIPNVRQKEKDFLMNEMKLLKEMGLNLEKPDPYLAALNVAFSDVAKPDNSPFHPMSYQFMGGREILFVNYLLGADVLDSIKPVAFERPEGERNRTEFDRKTFMKVPGVISSFVLNEAGNPKKLAYFELNNRSLTPSQKEGILERALEFYNSLQFGQVIYQRKMRFFPYECVMQDLTWTIANLDDKLLSPGTVLEGKLVEITRDFPIYEEGHEWEDEHLKRTEKRKERVMKLDSGEHLGFYEFSEFAKDKFSLGTNIKALMYTEKIEGFDMPVAAPFFIEN